MDRGLWFTALQAASSKQRKSLAVGNQAVDGCGNCMFFNNSEAVKSSGRLGKRRNVDTATAPVAPGEVMSGAVGGVAV